MTTAGIVCDVSSATIEVAERVKRHGIVADVSSIVPGEPIPASNDNNDNCGDNDNDDEQGNDTD